MGHVKCGISAASAAIVSFLQGAKKSSPFRGEDCNFSRRFYSDRILIAFETEMCFWQAEAAAAVSPVIRL